MVERGSRSGVSLCRSSVDGTWREVSPAGDPEGYIENALETGISSSRGAILGNLEEGGSFSRDPNDYERKALWMGISPHGGSVGQPGVGISSGDF